MPYQCWLGYLLCIPVAIGAYVLGTMRDAGKLALAERKLAESDADRKLWESKYDALNTSCTAITANAHAIEGRLADSEAAYAKAFKDCEQYKRQLSELRLKAAPAPAAPKKAAAKSRLDAKKSSDRSVN